MIIKNHWGLILCAYPAMPFSCVTNNSFRERLSKPKKQATVKPISAQDEKTLDTAIAMANEISTRSMTTPVPTTPVSPNKRKFSFRFPSVGEHEKSVEKRNFSEEARSSPDLQVRLITCEY